MAAKKRSAGPARTRPQKEVNAELQDLLSQPKADSKAQEIVRADNANILADISLWDSTAVTNAAGKLLSAMEQVFTVYQTTSGAVEILKRELEVLHGKDVVATS